MADQTLKGDFKVELEVKEGGRKFWRYEMEYFGLPPEYVVEVGSACQAFAAYVGGLVGSVGSSEGRGYEAEFSYSVSGGLTVPPPFEKTGKGKSKADRLAFSQVVQLQSDGILMQERLLNGARIEIKTGQRT